jgi:23S rRNA pseudouridine1911/1915/1917 synthase
MPPKLSVTDMESGTRLDRFVATRVEEISTRTAARLASRGGVLVNGRPAAKGRRLVAGDTVEILEEAIDSASPDFPPAADPEVQPVVLHRDARTLVLEKPPGMHTAPLRGSEKGSLLGGALALVPAMAQVTGYHRREAGLVHRLDRDTSGTCLFALDQDAFERLRTATESDLVVKDYHAIVDGRLMDGPPLLEAEVPAGRARGRQVPVRSVRRKKSRRLEPRRLEDGTRLLRMRVEILDRTARHSLLRVKLTRGYRHQVRAVLAAIGHPVQGDALYGHGGEGELMLHASRIVFPHPDDGRLVRVDSGPARLDGRWERLSGG